MAGDEDGDTSIGGPAILRSNIVSLKVTEKGGNSGGDISIHGRDTSCHAIVLAPGGHSTGLHKHSLKVGGYNGVGPNVWSSRAHANGMASCDPHHCA